MQYVRPAVTANDACAQTKRRRGRESRSVETRGATTEHHPRIHRYYAASFLDAGHFFDCSTVRRAARAASAASEKPASTKDASTSERCGSP